MYEYAEKSKKNQGCRLFFQDADFTVQIPDIFRSMARFYVGYGEAILKLNVDKAVVNFIEHGQITTGSGHTVSLKNGVLYPIFSFFLCQIISSWMAFGTFLNRANSMEKVPCPWVILRSVVE